MKRRITHIDPLQAGKVMAVIHASMSLIIVPFFLIFGLIGALAGRGSGGGISLIFALLMAVIAPIFYGIMGFIIGLLGAFVYNFTSQWTGGFEVTVADGEAPPPMLPTYEPARPAPPAPY